MRSFSAKQKVAAVVLGAGVIAAAGGGVAYAFWTTSGTGTATATTGSNAPVALTGTADNAVTPNGVTATVTISVNNPAPGPQYVTKVHLVGVDAFSNAARTSPIPTGTGVGNCDTSKYTMPDVTENYDAPTGSSSLPVTGTLSLADDTLNNQDACKGAFLTLNLSSS